MTWPSWPSRSRTLRRMERKNDKKGQSEQKKKAKRRSMRIGASRFPYAVGVRVGVVIGCFFCTVFFAAPCQDPSLVARGLMHGGASNLCSNMVDNTPSHHLRDHSSPNCIFPVLQCKCYRSKFIQIRKPTPAREKYQKGSQHRHKTGKLTPARKKLKEGKPTPAIVAIFLKLRIVCILGTLTTRL